MPAKKAAPDPGDQPRHARSPRGASISIAIVMLVGCRAKQSTPDDQPEPPPIASEVSIATSTSGESKPEELAGESGGESETGPVEPEPAVRLDVDKLAYLPAPGNGMFQLKHEQPSLALIIDDELDHAARAELARALVEDQRHATLDATQAAALGLVRPEQVWMFGADGPCRAKLGSAYAIADQDGPLVLELGYVVEPCVADFAPVAYLDAAAPELNWRDVECSRPTKLAKIDTWKHPHRAAYEQLGLLGWKPDDDHPSAPEQLWIRSCSVGPVVSLAWSWVWPDNECWEAEHHVHELGLWQGATFERLESDDWTDTPKLIGALMAADEAVVIIASGAPQMHVGVGGEQQFRWFELSVGSFHDEVVAARTGGWRVMDCDSEP